MSVSESIRPAIVTFDGPDKRGKSTTISALHARLREAGVNAVVRTSSALVGGYDRDDFRRLSPAGRFFAGVTNCRLLWGPLLPLNAEVVLIDRSVLSTIAYTEGSIPKLMGLAQEVAPRIFHADVRVLVCGSRVAPLEEHEVADEARVEARFRQLEACVSAAFGRMHVYEPTPGEPEALARTLYPLVRDIALWRRREELHR